MCTAEYSSSRAHGFKRSQPTPSGYYTELVAHSFVRQRSWLPLAPSWRICRNKQVGNRVCFHTPQTPTLKARGESSIPWNFEKFEKKKKNREQRKVHVEKRARPKIRITCMSNYILNAVTTMVIEEHAEKKHRVGARYCIIPRNKIPSDKKSRTRVYRACLNLNLHFAYSSSIQHTV